MNEESPGLSNMKVFRLLFESWSHLCSGGSPTPLEDERGTASQGAPMCKVLYLGNHFINHGGVIAVKKQSILGGFFFFFSNAITLLCYFLLKIVTLLVTLLLDYSVTSPEKYN